ncbi:MAG: hypothetical protein ACR2LS_03395 [Thermomicrobiales bacterium]
MRDTDQHLRQVEEQILAIVRQAEGLYPSGEVVRQLSEQGIARADVKIALWYLVDRDQLRFDMDWRLTPPAATSPPVTTVG